MPAPDEAAASKPEGAAPMPLEPPPGEMPAVEAEAPPEMGMMGMGMMGGVMPPGMGGRRGPGGAAPPEVKYDPTAWGRYVKILLSSSEFLYIN